MPCSAGLVPIRWLFAIVVLTLRPKTIPIATLPLKRFPTTVVLRAPKTSITPASLSLKPRNVKPETLTSLTRGPVSSPVSKFTLPTTQIARQGESALAVVGASITASSPRSLIPFLVIITSSLWTPLTTMVSPGSAAFTAFWMDSPGPTTELSAPAEPIVAASTTPLATNRVRAMVLNKTMVRLIKRASFLVAPCGLRSTNLPISRCSPPSSPWVRTFERVGWPGIPDHYRIAFDVPQDDDPTRIMILTEVSDLIATALIEDVQAARGLTTIPGVLGQVIDEHFELLALESSYGYRLWFGGFQIGVVLQPPDQVLGSLLHVGRAGFEDFLDVREL